MRSVATVLIWIVTTVLVAAAISAMWVQHNIVSQSGYAALAQRAAAEPEVRSAMADELATQIGRLGSNVNPALVRGIAGTYTASSAFPGQFGSANAYAHRWLFTNTVAADVDAQGRWVIDLAPMLSDVSFAQTLRDYNIAVPGQVPVPLTDNAPTMLRPGAFSLYGRWVPWLAWGLAVLAACSALLTVLVARKRGKALVALGVSGLLVGAAGWVAVEYAQRAVTEALDGLVGNVRVVADGMVVAARAGVHEWLNVTLAAGAGLVMIGAIVALLEGLHRGRNRSDSR